MCVPCAVCRARATSRSLLRSGLYAVIGQDGTFYRYAYDSEQGGEGKREDHILFLKDKEDD